MRKAFDFLRHSLMCAPALGLPDYTQPFHLFVEHGGTFCAVLVQEHGSGLCPCAYLLKTLDPVAAGLPPCLRAVAACALIVLDAEKIVLSHPLVLHTPHQVKHILQNLQTQHMTAQRRSGYETVLCSTANL
ncbi:MAG: RNase H-like domain-containing protein, partial [Cetobacterium sp.]